MKLHNLTLPEAKQDETAQEYAKRLKVALDSHLRDIKKVVNFTEEASASKSRLWFGV